jgi:uncharacterized membrane protein YecN with MAPEG domain
MTLQTTLSLAAAAAIINLWLIIRIGQLRARTKIFHGDGGNEPLMRRMRAQANFVENVPLVLILIAAIELTGKGGTWLAVVGSVFMLGRVLHPIGMDSPKLNALRGIGAGATMLITLGLAIVAVLIALGKF